MTYQLSTWDFEDQRWDLYASGPSLFALRPLLRRLRKAWSDDCLLLERTDLEPVGFMDRDQLREWRQDAIDLLEYEREAEIEDRAEHPLFASLESP